MKQQEKGVRVLHVDRETREAMNKETNPAVTKMLEDMKRFRDRSDHIFPEYPYIRKGGGNIVDDR